MADHERIAVDFDKTLTEGEKSYVNEEPENPDEEMVQWVNEQYAEGNTIIIWTSRPWGAAPDTVARLTEWGVDWHGIRMEKGKADAYVDDKGTTPTGVRASGRKGRSEEATFERFRYSS
jgi:hypothetical protein